MSAWGQLHTVVTQNAAVRRCLVGAGGLCFALGIAATAPFQRGSLIVVSVAALVVLVVGLRQPARPAAGMLTVRAALPWAVIFLCWCAWEVIMYYAGNSPQWPTLSILSDRVFDAPVGRFFGGIAWYWGAVWLVRATGAERR